MQTGVDKMKKISLFLLVLFIGASTLFSCGSKDDAPEGLQTADVSKRRAWPAARDGDEPGPGPRWGIARTADLFL